MKKFICFLLMMILSVSTATAEGLKAYKTSEKMIVNKLEVDENDQTAVAIIYDANGKIFSASNVYIKDKQADLELLYPETSFTLKLYTDIGTDKVYSLSYNELIEQKENEKEFIPVYGNTAAAIGAFAVVRDCAEFLNDNNEAVALVSVLYRGRETDLEFNLNYSLDNTVDGGKIAVTDLEEGDVLKLRANLSGMLSGADLIFRAPKKDSLSDSLEVSKIYTTVSNKENMNVYGIVADKDNKTLVLYNAGGLERDALYLDLDPNTVVYHYDNKARKEKVRVSSVVEIPKSIILKSDKDDNDNIINWNENTDRVYAYVRVYDGIVCDVLLFENL